MTPSIKKISLVSTISTLLFLLPSCGSKSKNESPGPNSGDSSTIISSFSLTDKSHTINIGTLSTINPIEMPYGTDQSKLIALFTAPSRKTIVKINGQEEKGDGSDLPISITVPANNIPVEVTAGDGTTKSTYFLNITEDSAPSENSLCNAVSCSQSKDALTEVLSSGVLTDGFTPVNMDCTIPNLNSEDEQYQKDMIAIKKDRLTINVKKTDTKVHFCNNPNNSFVSGRIDTSNKFNFTKDEQGTILNGAVEVTAAVPYGKGLWPAIWMLPLNSKWPTGMELDFAEFQSYSSAGAPLGTHVHYGNGDDQTAIVWNYNGNGADNLYMPNVSDASPLTPQVAHNYGFTWNCTAYQSACNLSWYFDGSKYLTMHLDPVSAQSYLLDSKGGKKSFVNQPKPPTWAKRPNDPAAAAFTSWWYGLDKGYYLILNVAVGGKGLDSDNQPDWDSFPDASMDILGIKSYHLLIK